MRFLLAMMVVAMLVVNGHAQESTPSPVSTPPVREMELPTESRFRKAVVKAIRSARKKGEMSSRQALRLRVAMMSPAFRSQAEDLAVIQMAFSGTDDPLPQGADGKIDRASIDWDGLLAFLEKLLPFILDLLNRFAIVSPTLDHLGVIV